MNLKKIDAFVFDFDGVLTDNRVYVDQDGKESVCCNRSDGLAFEALRKLKLPTFILSTEPNPVVAARAKKLQIPVLHGIKDKRKALLELCSQNKFDVKSIFYTGNDLNDYYVMKDCGYSACPFDSHPSIKEISDFLLSCRGGEGVVREILETIFKKNLLKILY
jgi:3-deoxy-D-manno-octulosonate 8-phosphate phosphatase (KDO 8-P phosphatase)